VDLKDLVDLVVDPRDPQNPPPAPRPRSRRAATEEPAGAATQGEVEAGGAAQPKTDRPVDEPEGATQDEQYGLIRETGNDRRDMTEEEEARLLEGEFGPADHHGIYGAAKGDE
jgi:hypothetical protein